jgi:hypothetical protein
MPIPEAGNIPQPSNLVKYGMVIVAAIGTGFVYRQIFPEGMNTKFWS